MDRAADSDRPEETSVQTAHPMRGLFIAQFLGTFNDNAWKQLVILLAVAAAVSEVEGQEHTAIAQIILMIPLMVISLPAGLLADRVSKRSVIVAMKVYELALMLAGTAVLFVEPQGGPLAMGVLALLGVQLALFSPAKYGILPEILPHERLSAGNGLLEMGSNLAILCGIVAGGVIISAAKKFQVPLWYGGVLLTTSAACGLLAALDDPSGQGRAIRGRDDRDAPDRLGIDPGRSRPEAHAHRPGSGLGDRQPDPRRRSCRMRRRSCFCPNGRRACRWPHWGSASAWAACSRASFRGEGRVRPAPAGAWA